MKKVELPFVTLEFHENYVLSEITEGADINSEHVRLGIEHVNHHYQSQPIGFIGRRINESSLNPMNYIEYPPLEAAGVVSFAVVAYRKSTAIIAQVERIFATRGGKVAFGVFSDFETAERWTLEHVLKARSANAV